MLKICLVFWESEPQYAYKRYAYKKKHVVFFWSLVYRKIGSVGRQKKILKMNIF